MYKKVKKSLNDPYGIRKETIKDFNRPFLFFSVPFGNVKGINGYLNSLIYLLRLRKGEDINNGVDISEAPFDLYSSSEIESENILQLLEETNIDDYDSLTRIFRNINFVSYCDGNNNLLRIIEGIHDKLKEKGLDKETINKLMSQIAVLQIVDNLGYDGDDFPYVTTITIHNRHDVENSRWLEEDLESEKGQFSKAFVKRLTDNKEVVIVEPFGEGSLKEGYEHNYTDDYLLSPVLNAIMSVCLIESLNSSLKGININLDYYQEGINFVLNKAYEYENKIGKELDLLTKEELKKFSQYMINVMNDYAKEKFNVDSMEISKFQQLNEDDKNIGEIARELSKNYENDIKGHVNQILKYKDNNVDDMDTIFVANTKQTMTVKSIVSLYYGNLIESVKRNIQDINNIHFKEKKRDEYNIQLVEWKKEKINGIYQLLDNDELRHILRDCGLKIEDNFKL